MRFIFVFLVMAVLQGPVLAFNPIKPVVSLPFKLVRLGVKVAQMPVKLAYRGSKTAIKTAAADKAAVFAIKRVDFAALAF